MKSAYVAPTARKDEAGNWLFTPDVISAYKNNLGESPEPGDTFTFLNGPYGGGRKFEVIGIRLKVVVARDWDI